MLQTTLRRLQTSGELFPFPYSIPIFTARLAPHILKPVSPCLYSQALHNMITRSTLSAHTSPHTLDRRTNRSCAALHTLTQTSTQQTSRDEGLSEFKANRGKIHFTFPVGNTDGTLKHTREHAHTCTHTNI